jgi:hypothetical protein
MTQEHRCDIRTADKQDALPAPGSSYRDQEEDQYGQTAGIGTVNYGCEDDQRQAELQRFLRAGEIRIWCPLLGGAVTGREPLFLNEDLRFKPVCNLSIANQAAVPDEDYGNSWIGNSVLPAHFQQFFPVVGIVIDFKPGKVEFRITGLKIGEERFYLFTMTATVTVKIECADSRIL